MKLLDQVRHSLALRHRSEATITAYVGWIRRYILFHNKVHPRELGPPDVVSFLEHLAVHEHVAESTQNQALCALVFLYDHVLLQPLGDIGRYARAQHPSRLPAVLSELEVRTLLARMEPEHRLAAQLLYGSGLRVGEVVTLRIKDLDLESLQATLRDTKSRRDRVTVLPRSLVAPIHEQIARVRQIFEADTRPGNVGVPLPNALDRKKPGAAYTFAWYYLFPSTTLHPAVDGRKLRWHMSPATIQRAVKEAVVAALPHRARRTRLKSGATDALSRWDGSGPRWSGRSGEPRPGGGPEGGRT